MFEATINHTTHAAVASQYIADAEIIAACGAWHAAWTAICDDCTDAAPTEEGWLREAIVHTRATTIDGLRAKASVISRLERNCDNIIASLCADLGVA